MDLEIAAIFFGKRRDVVVYICATYVVFNVQLILISVDDDYDDDDDDDDDVVVFHLRLFFLERSRSDIQLKVGLLTFLFETVVLSELTYLGKKKIIFFNTFGTGYGLVPRRVTHSMLV